MNDDLRGERLQVTLTGEELKALDDFRFVLRMPSRAAAVRELLKRGSRPKASSSPTGTRNPATTVSWRKAAKRAVTGLTGQNDSRRLDDLARNKAGADPLGPHGRGSLLQVRGERCRKRAADDPTSEAARRWLQLAAEYDQLADALESDGTEPRAQQSPMQQQPMQQQPMQQQQSKAEPDDDT